MILGSLKNMRRGTSKKPSKLVSMLEMTGKIPVIEIL